MNTQTTTEPTAPAVASSVLLADMQRCLLWMEHVNHCAEREEKMGHWLSNWSDAMNHWDAEYQRARDAFMSANAALCDPAHGDAGKPKTL